jgi:hypothetical protein
MGIDNPYLGTVENVDGTPWYSEPDADGEMYRNNAFTVVTDAQEIKGKYDTFLSNKQAREVSRNEEKNICNNYHLLNQYYASCRLRKYHRSF